MDEREPDTIIIEHEDIKFRIFHPNVEKILKGGRKVEGLNLVAMYRKGANLTQTDMANVLGIALNTYRALEENPSKFNVEQIKKFVAEINKYDANIKASDIFSL